MPWQSRREEQRLVDLLDPASRTAGKEREIALYLQRIRMPEKHSREELLYLIGFLAQDSEEKNLRKAPV